MREAGRYDAEAREAGAADYLVGRRCGGEIEIFYAEAKYEIAHRTANEFGSPLRRR